ncbi:MAG: ABC transporter permease [Alphaproteobacteria bacterium]|tara:strand:+ start:7075 stop:8037 length:963 start_codon:yes stop_codon:yes gene_type:complete
MNENLKKIFKIREVPLFIFIIIVGILGSFISPYFLLSANFSAVFLGLSLDAIIVIAMCMLLISGGFDLSVGANLAFSGMVCAICMANFGMPWPIACVVAISCGTMVGVANGLMVTRFYVNPLIATLGMLTIVRSLVLIISGDRAMSSFPKAFQLIGQGKIFGIPNPIWIFILFVILAEFVLRTMKMGRLPFFVGSNPQAAELSGLRVKRIQFILYALCGCAAGIAGVVSTARLNAAFPLAGNGAELRIIAAAVIGGCSLSGGQGSIIGAFLGVVLMAMINNLLILTGVPVYYQGLVAGLVLIGAVGFDEYSKRRRGEIRS